MEGTTIAAKPLEVPLTGRRRVLLDVDGADWRVAYYYPEKPHREVVELEKRARTGEERARVALERLPMRRGTGRAPLLRDALTAAMTKRHEDGFLVRTESPGLAEVETIARYVLEHRYAEQNGRRA